ncbi:MAG TPA: TolC family protein [Candidatus Dormibacteraeota bacterium]|nr:TolC family protein [Candidatus Dormibacteraeota bacterium]
MSRRPFRCLAVLTLGASLITAPVAPGFAQAQEPAKPQPATPQSRDSSAGPPPASLHLSSHEFARGPRTFPFIFNAYRPVNIERMSFTNGPRIEQLIHNGKLELSLQDAIELGLENNLDITVQRYNPWIADTDILRAKGGSVGRGSVPSSTFAEGSVPVQNFDPAIISNFLIDDRKIPVNNPFTAGTGVASLSALTIHTSQFNTQYQQGFVTGTGLGVGFNNTRNSTTSPAAIFNPSVQSSLSLSFSQQLLNGFGPFVNTRFIRIAKINRKIADFTFSQQAITTINQVENDYWELVFARENVKVRQEAVAVAEKLYSDNKRQVEIGTMAPIDVVRAEAEVATGRQNLIVAQTVQLQQQTLLLSAITKNPLDPAVANVEIVPTDAAVQPPQMDIAPLPDAVREALDRRPDVQIQLQDLKARDINLRVTKNALLPTATLFGTYNSQGLAGNARIFAPTVIPGAAILDQNGQPVTVVTPTGTTRIFLPPTAGSRVSGVATGGISDALSNVFHNRFPDYSVQLSLNVPLRNRVAQADSARALLEERQSEARLHQLQNSVVIDVRNTQIALEQDRARVDAAIKARILQEQTLDAEQKKYHLGASTPFFVIQAQRDLSNARSAELRALVDLVKAKLDYERALGRTLDINHVSIASAESPNPPAPETLIPGTIDGQVIGTPQSY